MSYKPNYQLQDNGRKRIDFSSRLSYYEETQRNRDTQQERIADSNNRSTIQSRIRELKELGFPKEEALKRLESEFPNSQYSGYFTSWVDNAYTEKKGQRTFRRVIKKDIEEK